MAKLQIHAVGEFFCVFHQGSELHDSLRTDLIGKNDAMRIPDGQAGGFVFLVSKGEYLIDYLADLSRDRDLAGDKGSLSHVNAELGCPGIQCFHMHGTGQSFDVEFGISDIALIDQIFGKDTDTVAADGGFASIGIKNADSHFSVDLDRTVQNAVCTKAEAAAAHQCDLLADQLHMILFRVEDQIIVSKSLVFRKNDSAHLVCPFMKSSV